MATTEAEGLGIVIKFPRPGTPWAPRCRVDLEVVVGNRGAAAARVKQDPAVVEVCYWGGTGAPTCRPLLASETASVAMAAPSSGLAEVSAWLRWAAPLPGPAAAEDDATAAVGDGRRRTGATASAFLWVDPMAAAAELRRRLAALGEPTAASLAAAAHLRAHLRRATSVPQVSVVSNVFGSYRKEIGFGTYGLENAAFHYWGSANASITFGRFGAFAPDCEFFLGIKFTALL